MTEKCPSAACWFRLKDDTGSVKVDLKSAGFTVSDVAVGTTVTVAGTLQRTADGGVLDATGLRY
jgi:uncharacterized protein YdeI (BOF family)